MAARPGEELVATLFADIHYYYGPPTAKPPHHRFEKGSYVYLFENALHRRARVEVANNAGTPEQDAFNGHLDSTHVQYSYKHSTLISLTVDGANRGGPPPDGQEWHLPTFDPRNENKYMYRLHSVDIYFWVKEDALQFLNGVRRVLPHQQVIVQDEPIAPPPHQHDMSAVVQKLENVAITDPSYQQGQTRNSQTTSVPSALSRSSTGTFPGPPINSISRSNTTTFPGPPISATPQSNEAPNFAPLAYNPAAPAAPETIQHREKTPPPEDGAGNPLVAAAVSEQGQTYGVPFQHPGGFSGPPAAQQVNYFSGPPAASAPPQFNQPPPSTGFQSQFSQPPPSAGLQSPYAQHFQHSFAAPPTAPVAPAPHSQPSPSAVASAPGPQPYQQSSPAPSAPHIPVTQQYAQYPGSPGQSSAGLSSPGIYSPLGAPTNFSVSQAPTQPTPPPASAPPGGFSSYQYQPLSNTKPHETDYSIHQQVYRPTEGESAPKAKKEVKPPKGKLEERAGRVEKLGGSLFKKLEKKIG